MRPAPPIVIRGAQKTLEELAAGRTDEQEISRILGLMALLSMLEDEWDVCASSRMTGIVRYADIVRRGSALVDGARRDRLDQAMRAAEGVGVADDAGPGHRDIGVLVEIIANIARVDIEQIIFVLDFLRFVGRTIRGIGDTRNEAWQNKQGQGYSAIHKFHLI